MSDGEDFIKHLLYFYHLFFNIGTQLCTLPSPGLNIKTMVLNETVSTLENVMSAFCKFQIVGK